MKLRGEFVVRQLMDEIVAIPVGNQPVGGMVLLNPVSAEIWKALEQETDLEGIVSAVTDAFEVSEEEARADILELLEQLRNAGLLDE